MARSDFTFKVVGATQLKKRLQIQKLGLKPLRDYFTGTAIVIKRKARQAAPKYTMNLRSAIKYKPLGTRGKLPGGVKIYIDESTAPYAPFVHGYMDINYRQSKPWDRTKPHFPPLKAITGWANAKGIPPFVVALSIAKKGTPIIPFLKIGYNRSRAERNAMNAKLSRDITQQWKKGRNTMVKK